MYAVFETGGKQYKAGKGDVVFVEKLAVEPGKAVSFDALMIADGSDVMIGTPTVKGAKVKAKVIEHGKERKVVIFKYNPKKDYRRKQGHRQPFTKIEITGITTSAGKEAAEEVTAAVETKPAAKATAAKTAAAKPAEVKTTAAKAATAKPAAEKSAAKTTAAKPAAKTAAAKPAAEKPAAAKPAVKKPAAKAAAEPEKAAE